MDDKRQLANFITGPHGRLAYIRHDDAECPSRPGLIWLGGYASDMRGTKAEVLAAHARDKGLNYLRFDYSGHGESGGAFEDGTISRWANDAAYMIEQLTDGPQILVGSSMGGWIAGLLARRMPKRIKGLVLIAPAPDFATELTPKQWTEERWATVQRDGIIRIPSDYDDSVMVYTKAMFEDGARHTVLDRPLPYSGPVRILTGMKDDVVPWQHAVRYAEHFESSDVALTLVKDGDHRMSSEGDLQRLCATIDDILGAAP